MTEQATAVRADIQGLRAFAVLAVMLEHLLHWPRGGFVGVDVFFVISGYLITAHLVRELERTGRLSLADFYRRRAQRILPAAVLVLLVTVGVSAVVVTRSRALATAVDAGWTLAFAANWRFLSVGTDYFELGQLKSPLQHFWSLSVEEQFYFVWPLLAAGAFALRPRPKVLALVFGAVSAGSLAWALFETSSRPTSAYFSTFSRAWELGAGAVLAALTARGLTLPSGARVVLGWSGLVGLCASLVVISPQSAFPAPAALLPVLSTALVIAAGTGATNGTYARLMSPLTNRASGHVGAISYSLYLWHFPVVVLLPALLAVESPQFLLVGALLTWGLSELSYRFVEQPIRSASWFAPEARGRRAYAIGALVLLVTTSVTLVGLRKVAHQGPAFTTATRTDPCFGAGASLGAGRGCAVTRPSRDTVVPSVDDLDADISDAYACWRDEGGALKTCTWGSQAPGALRVALVGDSHAATLLPAMKSQSARFGWRLDSYLGYGCQWRLHPANSDCAGVMAQTQERLLAQRYDVVVTTAARWAIADASVASFIDAWRPVRAAGTEVIVIAPVPEVSAAMFECIHRRTAALADCKTPRATAFGTPDVLRAAALESGTPLVDLSDFYCDAEACPAVIGDAFVFRDRVGHVSGTYGATLAPFLGDALQAALERRSDGGVR